MRPSPLQNKPAKSQSMATGEGAEGHVLALHDAIQLVADVLAGARVLHAVRKLDALRDLCDDADIYRVGLGIDAALEEPLAVGEAEVGERLAL